VKAKTGMGPMSLISMNYFSKHIAAVVRTESPSKKQLLIEHMPLNKTDWMYFVLVYFLFILYSHEVANKLCFCKSHNFHSYYPELTIYKKYFKCSCVEAKHSSRRVVRIKEYITFLKYILW